MTIGTAPPSLEVLLADESVVWVDVRSPGEFDRDHVPGAKNLPLLDDEQRAVVGALYNKEGEEPAWERGAGYMREKIAEFVDWIADSVGMAPAIDPEKAYDEIAGSLLKKGKFRRSELPDASHRPLVIYCWRGGLRSEAFVELCRRVGFAAHKIEDGYKAYRHHVLEELAALECPPMVVLTGMSGTGKTALLRRLEDRFPDQVLNLEGLANHRSSLLGHHGLEPISKPAFDSALAHWFRSKEREFVLLEGESRRIGKLEIPARIYEAMQSGIQLLLEAPLDVRARRLVEEYRAAGPLHELRDRVVQLSERLRQHGSQVRKAFDEEEYETTARLLLEHYYDPRYRHAIEAIPIKEVIDATDLDKAEKHILHFLGSG